MYHSDPLKPFRMPIVDKYRDMGTMVMGKSEQGLVQIGDVLQVRVGGCVAVVCVLVAVCVCGWWVLCSKSVLFVAVLTKGTSVVASRCDALFDVSLSAPP